MSISRAPAARTRAYHHGNLRRSLLDTARALAAEVGIDGFSLREVSRRAGVSHAAAYNHFADKSRLVEALVIEAFRALAAALREAEARNTDPVVRLQAIGIAYVRFAYDHPAEFRFMFRPELCPAPPPLDTSSQPTHPSPLEAAGYDAYGVLVNNVAAALEAGEIVGGSLEALTLASWSAVHGLAGLILDGPDPSLAPNAAAAEELARSVTSVLLEGMRA